MDPIKVIVLACSLNSSSTESSSELIGRQILDEMGQYGAEGEIIRAVDHDIKPGVELDMGNGDAWPAIRAKIIDADILLISTPIWMGQPCSVAKRVLERLDAELSETDDEGRLLTYGKIGAASIVGNEDGAHHSSAEIFQALSDVGFTIPAGGPAYWVGEAMGSTDYKDLPETPEKTMTTIKSVAANSVHLAKILKAQPYPAVS